jgi:hypothetical protein
MASYLNKMIQSTCQKSPLESILLLPTIPPAHYTVTARDRIFLYKLRASHLLMKSLAFCGTCRFLAVPTTASPIKFSPQPYNSINSRFTLILYSHLCLGLATGHFLSHVSTRKYLSSVPCVLSTSSSFIHRPYNIWLIVQINGRFSAASC